MYSYTSKEARQRQASLRSNASVQRRFSNDGSWRRFLKYMHYPLVYLLQWPTLQLNDGTQGKQGAMTVVPWRPFHLSAPLEVWSQAMAKQTHRSLLFHCYCYSVSHFIACTATAGAWTSCICMSNTCSWSSADWPLKLYRGNLALSYVYRQNLGFSATVLLPRQSSHGTHPNTKAAHHLTAPGIHV